MVADIGIVKVTRPLALVVHNSADHERWRLNRFNNFCGFDLGKGSICFW
jgi:hypothetical protein